MANEPSKSVEKVNASSKPEQVSGGEAMGNVDSLSEIGGRLSEIVSELPPEQKSGSSSQKKAQKLTPAQLKENLLKNLPSERRMKSEIESQIKDQISDLKSTAKRMYWIPTTNYFELNNLVAKIRELNEILTSLISATFDMIKSLWLRYVHGINF